MYKENKTMKELFKIKDLTFYEEDYQDDIEEYSDIIPIIQDFADNSFSFKDSIIKLNSLNMHL